MSFAPLAELVDGLPNLCGAEERVEEVTRTRQPVFLPQTNLRLDRLQAVFAVDRLISPVGRAYRELVAEWKNILPAQSFSLGPCSGG